MLNFSNATQLPSNDGAPRGQYQQPTIPQGTKLLASFKLHDVPFCYNSQSGYIAADQTTGLLKFFFELTILAPKQYSGQKLGGSKMVTEAVQHQMGIAANDYSPCAKGDRAVHAIIACDALVKNRQPDYQISTYRNLDGLVCACEVGAFNGKTCIRVFLDPTNPRDRAEVQKLIEQANASDPGRMPDVPSSWPSPERSLEIF